MPAAPASSTGTGIANGGEVLGARIVPPTAIVAAGPNAPRGTVALDNPGGGYATVRVIEASAASETIVDFFNRSNPGQVKVCKIAGPGIPLGTLFRFSVFGPFGTIDIRNPDTAPNSPQFSVYGPVQTIVDVTAGPAETGGNCVIVPGLGAGVGRAEFQTFVNGTPVLVVENGISPNNTVPVPPGAIRVSRVRVVSPAAGTTLLPGGTGAGQAGFTPNPDLTPAPAGFDGRLPANTVPATEPRLARVAFNQRPGEVLTEFVNFVFNPTILKICKNAATAAQAGQSVNFTTTQTAGPLGSGLPQGAGGALFPAATTTTSVVSALPTAGNPTPSCTVVEGGGFPGGGFNVGQFVQVQETVPAGQVVQRCDSPTNGGALLPAGGAPVVNGLCGFGNAGPTPGLVAGTNVIVFTNGAAPAPPPAEGTAFDFDGDGRADASIYRPSTGMWSYAASSSSNDIRSTKWGVPTDIPVAADYDADGKTDIAVFRSGIWYIVGSTEGYKTVQFGSAGDIPQPGDYDGDGKADAAVFRPSNGTWYMNGTSKGFTAVQFGISTDKPVAADYDGDGKMDQAVYRSGAWYMNNSATGFKGVNWGLATDIPVPADYNGDGKADATVYRGGNWYILGENYTFKHINWGTATDKPVPADYDGDGKADATVYRSGMWYSLPSITSASGFTSIQLGDGSDTPIPASLQ
jgi:hypothetical protein